MRRRSVLLGAVAVGAIAAAAFLWLTEPRSPLTGADLAELATPADLANGKVVFTAGDCASCHATPAKGLDDPDPTKLGGGLALSTPFGTFHVPNISSSPTDGIGTWKVADFANAVLGGISPQGTHYYPIFPYTSYAHMRIDDVRDLFAYVHSLPSVAGESPPHELKFPFGFRRGIGLWKLLYLRKTPIQADPAQSDAWNRGHYLVDGPAHCAECHSPRNFIGGIIESQRFAGGPNIEGAGWVPNITPGPGGIGDWSKDDLVELLTNGDTPDMDDVGSSMVDVVRDTGQLSDADRDAIATYIKSLPARTGPPKPPKAASGS